MKFVYFTYIALCVCCTCAFHSNPQPPVWPFQWNATLAKINPNNNWIWWTKFYYDWPNKVARFDFYNGYYDMNDNWSLNCSVLFTEDANIWFVFPDQEQCTLDHKGIPTISPSWLQTATYQETKLFRGMECDRWRLEDLGIDYWARSEDYIPVRSTNQANDPGATDYYDVVVGPQNPSLFVLPSYCTTRQSNLGCPPF